MQKLKKQQNIQELYRSTVIVNEEQKNKERDNILEQKMKEKQLKDNYDQDEKIIKKHEVL